MPDLNEPLVRKVGRAHFFMGVIVWRIFWIDHDMAIVIRRARVVAPNVCLRHLMIWIVASRRQVRIVSEDLSDLENSSRRAAVALFFSKTLLVLPGKARTSGESILAK